MAGPILTDDIRRDFADLQERVKRLERTLNSTDWIAPSLSNGWVWYGSPWSVVGYMKDGLGFVHLRGLIKNGTINASAFTLPVGFRPYYSFLTSTYTNTGVGRLTVLGSGEVIPEVGGNGYFSIDNVSFRAEA